jgi:hypothetical protein
MKHLEPLREMVSGADELGGLDEDYGRRFLPPADFIFDVGDDEAKDFNDDTVSLGGELLSAKALSGLPRKIFESVMPPSMVDGLFDGGSLSPKRISITIVKMSPRNQTSLLDSIKDFTSRAGDEIEDVECGSEDGKKCNDKEEDEED